MNWPEGRTLVVLIPIKGLLFRACVWGFKLLAHRAVLSPPSHQVTFLTPVPVQNHFEAAFDLSYLQYWEVQIQNLLRCSQDVRFNVPHFSGVGLPHLKD